jgi:hypothetical protein
MKSERLQILNMVQEGRVSPEEAAKLLEALEQPAAAPKRGAAVSRPTHVRLVTREGGKNRSFSVGIGLARWVLHLPGALIQWQDGDRKVDLSILLQAIEDGFVGKVMEANEGSNHIEIWLDA